MQFGCLTYSQKKGKIEDCQKFIKVHNIYPWLLHIELLFLCMFLKIQYEIISQEFLHERTLLCKILVIWCVTFWSMMIINIIVNLQVLHMNQCVDYLLSSECFDYFIGPYVELLRYMMLIMFLSNKFLKRSMLFNFFVII